MTTQKTISLTTPNGDRKELVIASFVRKLKIPTREGCYRGFGYVEYQPTGKRDDRGLEVWSPLLAI